MKEYLKMSDMFKGELSIDCDCDDVIVDELSLTVLESFGGSDLAKYALHAINSHDELVARVNELESFLHHFVDNSHNVDTGGSDFTATTCEALEMAENLDNRAYDDMWHGH